VNGNTQFVKPQGPSEVAASWPAGHAFAFAFVEYPKQMYFMYFIVLLLLVGASSTALRAGSFIL
jgi:hypothetical protein